MKKNDSQIYVKSDGNVLCIKVQTNIIYFNTYGTSSYFFSLYFFYLVIILYKKFCLYTELNSFCITVR